MNVPSTCRSRLPRRSAIAAASLGLALAGFAGAALAQTRGRANIDFPFVVGSTQFPAGTYDFSVEDKKLLVRSTDPKGPTAIVLVVTRLGRHDKDTVPEFVFDKVGDQARLSEFWPPIEDGYLVLATPGAHEHRVVNGPNAHD